MLVALGESACGSTHTRETPLTAPLLLEYEPRGTSHTHANGTICRRARASAVGEAAAGTLIVGSARRGSKGLRVGVPPLRKIGVPILSGIPLP